MTRREFLAAIGLGALSLVLVRVATLQSTITALVPDAPRSVGPYGQSAYGE